MGMNVLWYECPKYHVYSYSLALVKQHGTQCILHHLRALGDYHHQSTAQAWACPTTQD